MHLLLTAVVCALVGCSSAPAGSRLRAETTPPGGAAEDTAGGAAEDTTANVPLPGAPDLLLHNGKIFTAATGPEFVTALAIDAEGQITWIGDDPAGLMSSAKAKIDLQGRVVLPGFHDVHQHTLEAHLEVIDCILEDGETAQDPEDHYVTIAKCAPGKDTGWVLGWGHSVLTLLAALRPPREILDEAFPTTPVAIMEMTSHSTWVNTAALTALKIDANTPDPPGGIIVREDDGSASGILVDSAGEWPWDLALAQSPALDTKNYDALRTGQANNSRHGITSAVDARVYWKRGHLAAYQKAADNDHLTARTTLSLWAYPSAEDAQQLDALVAMYAAPTEADALLHTTQVKLYSDGLLENTTAALLQPYRVETWGPKTGLSYFDQARIAKYATHLQAVGFDLHIHAIGDRAVRESLNAIEAAKASPGGDKARHRLTHVEIIHPDDIPRFAALGVYADMQLTQYNHPDRVHEYDEYLGSAVVTERAWPLRTLHESMRQANIGAALSSDYDVSPLSPFEGIQRAVTRGDQSLPSVEEAVRAYTVFPAAITHSEQQTGTLQPGKAADLIVVDKDIFTIPKTDIAKTRVLWTLLQGDEVFRHPDF